MPFYNVLIINVLECGSAVGCSVLIQLVYDNGMVADHSARSAFMVFLNLCYPHVWFTLFTS